jgi:hypothetical protein
MKTSSAKAKGRNLQKWVRDKILERFPELEKDDVQSTSMGSQGEDIKLSPTARKLFPFSVECKNLASFGGYRFYDQATENAKGHIPIVVVKANRRQPIVLIDVDDFLRILK